MGLDLNFDESAWSLAFAIAIDPSQVTVDVTNNEYVPGTDASIEATFVDQLDTILGFIDIDGLLGDLNFGLPSFASGDLVMGISAIDVEPAGVADEDLGIYATLGEVEYASTGCGSEESGEGGCVDMGGGCEDSSGGCEESSGGCSVSGRAGARGFLAIFVLMLGMRRRHS